MMRNAFGNINKTKKNDRPRIVGEIRQNQLITSFGVGSIVDFVNETVIIAGTDRWDTSEDFRIYNENLQSITGAKYFVKPKINIDSLPSAYSKTKDVPSYTFPEKLYCTYCKNISNYSEYEYSTNNKKVRKCIFCESYNTVVPSRFVVVCENGHIEDFPFSWWVHKGATCSSGKDNPRIKMYNVGDKSDLSSLLLECSDCGLKRSLRNAFGEYALAGENGYICKGNLPHLESYHSRNNEECKAPLKTRLRTSSGVYFPVIISALSIPPWSKIAMKIISKNFEDLKESLEYVPEDKVENFLSKKLSKRQNSKITTKQLLEAFYIYDKKRNLDVVKSQKDIYYDEYKALCDGDADEDEFKSYKTNVPIKFSNYFDDIVIVDKLTEVQSLIGFTRVKPWQGSDYNDTRIVPLSFEEKEWLPAVQMNGEGIFIKFNQDRINKWNDYCNSRYKKMGENLENSFYSNDRFSSQYVLLHTFAHLFIRELSNECGYNVASIKEKIYSTFFDEDNNKPIAGVLIYTASSDSDGSLGGLINIASQTTLFEKIIDNMIEKASWCSADPLCLSTTGQGFESLNYSACHDCTLLPETSCEFRNVLLDRVAIVGNDVDKKIGFFFECLK